MKKLFLSLTLLSAFAAAGATYILSWPPSPSAGVHYRIYSSTNGTTWKFERAVTNTLTTTLTNVPLNVVEFGITAADTNGSESSKAVGEVLFPPGSVGVVAQ